MLAAVMVGLVPEPLPAGAIGLMGGPLIAGLGLPFSAAQTLDPSFRVPAGAARWAWATRSCWRISCWHR